MRRPIAEYCEVARAATPNVIQSRCPLSGVKRTSHWQSLKSGCLKEVAVMKSILASTAVVVTFCATPAVSAEFPKTGEAEYETYYVDNVVAKFDSGAGTGGNR